MITCLISIDRRNARQEKIGKPCAIKSEATEHVLWNENDRQMSTFHSHLWAAKGTVTLESWENDDLKTFNN